VERTIGFPIWGRGKAEGNFTQRAKRKNENRRCTIKEKKRSRDREVKVDSLTGDGKLTEKTFEKLKTCPRVRGSRVKSFEKKD